MFMVGASESGPGVGSPSVFGQGYPVRVESHAIRLGIIAQSCGGTPSHGLGIGIPRGEESAWERRTIAPMQTA